MLNIASSILGFSIISHLQTESRMQQGIFVHVVPVRLVLWQEQREQRLLPVGFSSQFLSVSLSPSLRKRSLSKNLGKIKQPG